MKVCYSCASPCTSCIGNNGGSYFCLSCISSMFLYDYTCVNPCPGGMIGYNGQCYSSCPQTTYYNTIGQTCSSCGPNCLECTNITYCFTCATGIYLYAGGCTTTCISHYYGSNEVSLCLICHSTCL
jgi:proprotein convertase subtilisin/kexin type 5